MHVPVSRRSEGHDYKKQVEAILLAQANLARTDHQPATDWYNLAALIATSELSRLTDASYSILCEPEVQLIHCGYQLIRSAVLWQVVKILYQYNTFHQNNTYNIKNVVCSLNTSTITTNDDQKPTSCLSE